MSERSVSFGPFVLNPETGTLLRDGLPVQLSYRAFLLLKALVERPGDVFTKAQLFDAGWPGTVVEETNLSVQMAALRKVLGIAPGDHEWIATIPRVGYRFQGEVNPLADTRPSTRQQQLSGRESGPSIAVLPFSNLSPDPDQEYFADGIVEDIITGLSRLRWLAVVARNSSFAYKGRIADVRTIAAELGVRYVLEGGVRRGGDSLRVTSRLVDGTSGNQVWAQQYTGAVGDVFAVQDKIARGVVASIEPQLYAAEDSLTQQRPSESIDAWGYAMRAMAQIWTWDETENAKARDNLAHAIEIDPRYPRAHGLLALSYMTGAHMGWLRASEVVPPAREAARRSVAADSDDPWGHLALGYVHMLSRQSGPAVDELSEAIWLNPNFAIGHLLLGAAHGFGGDGDEGLKHLAIGAELSPRDPHQALSLSAIGLCHFVAGRYAESIAANRRAIHLRPRFNSAWRTLAAAAGLSGDLETGASALLEARRLQPDLSAEWVEAHLPLVRPADRGRFIEGLRQVGL
ncbi:MAG: winged helix-turn-helix domain-containing protein [Devosia sp.]